MKINAIGSSLCYGNTKKANTFKGFIGKISTKAVSMPRWSYSAKVACGTYHTITTTTYYRFTDDDDKDVNRVLSENTFFRTKGINPDPRSTDQFDTIEEGNVEVKNVPLTEKEYFNYANGIMVNPQKTAISEKLKKAKLRELIKR